MGNSYVCPKPKKWLEIQLRLAEFRSAQPNKWTIPDVPMALARAAWGRTSDNEKLVRWQETLKWAKKHGAESMLPELKDADVYFGSETGQRVKAD